MHWSYRSGIQKDVVRSSSRCEICTISGGWSVSLFDICSSVPTFWISMTVTATRIEARIDFSTQRTRDSFTQRTSWGGVCRSRTVYPTLPSTLLSTSSNENLSLSSRRKESSQMDRVWYSTCQRAHQTLFIRGITRVINDPTFITAHCCRQTDKSSLSKLWFWFEVSQHT